MARLRFETVRDVFEAFPIAEHELNIEPNDEPSLRFLETLVSSGEFDKAVGFCAFLLPRREAVWWGCRAVRMLVPNLSAEEAKAIRVAEDWVHEPEEDRRAAALETGDGGETIPVAPHQTARVVRAAVLVAACRVSVAEKPDLLRRCLEDGIQIAADESEGA